MITVERKKELIDQFKVNNKDVGSNQVQVALLTEQIKNLTEHLKVNRKDHMTRRGLMKLVGRRSKLLKNIRSNDMATYKDVISRLNLRH